VLAVVLTGRRARAGLGYGLLAGLGLFVPLLSWTGAYVGPLPWLVLAVLQAGFVAATGAGIAAVSRLPGWPLWAAAVWVAGEAARSRIPFGGVLRLDGSVVRITDPLVFRSPDQVATAVQTALAQP
jgi:apolipoprotein N-acyltransferase